MSINNLIEVTLVGFDSPFAQVAFIWWESCVVGTMERQSGMAGCAHHVLGIEFLCPHHLSPSRFISETAYAALRDGIPSLWNKTSWSVGHRNS